MLTLTPLLPADAARVVVHLVRNARESGRDGDPFSRARSADEPVDEEGMRQRIEERVVRPLSVVEWERWWIVSDPGGQVRGHLDLRGAALPSALHRAQIGIGLERGWRGHGWGERLMRTAIGWARAERLSWLDLGVFADNLPARGLYRKLGFVEVGLIEDAFRIDGHSVDDVSMVLDLAGDPPPSRPAAR